MPNAGDIKVDTDASFLLVGDGGTQKTGFIGSCPSPTYVFDTDKGMARLRGRSDIDYDTFRELPKGKSIGKGKVFTKEEGWYEWGTGWPGFLNKLNERGKEIDDGASKYLTIGVDSLTMLTDIAMSYILRENKRDAMEQRDWNAFLSNMTSVFSQLTAWPLIKVLTAHVRRDENLLSGTTEKLPLVPGQFSGKVCTLFDEVYYTTVKVESGKAPIWTLQTISGYPDGSVKQAKSRKYNIPNGTPTDFAAIMKHIKAA